MQRRNMMEKPQAHTSTTAATPKYNTATRREETAASNVEGAVYRVAAAAAALDAWTLRQLVSASPPRDMAHPVAGPAAAASTLARISAG